MLAIEKVLQSIGLELRPEAISSRTRSLLPTFLQTKFTSNILIDISIIDSFLNLKWEAQENLAINSLLKRVYQKIKE